MLDLGDGRYTAQIMSSHAVGNVQLTVYDDDIRALDGAAFPFETVLHQDCVVSSSLCPVLGSPSAGGGVAGDVQVTWQFSADPVPKWAREAFSLIHGTGNLAKRMPGKLDVDEHILTFTPSRALKPASPASAPSNCTRRGERAKGALGVGHFPSPTAQHGN